MGALRRGRGLPLVLAALVLAVVAGCGLGGGDSRDAQWTAPVPAGASASSPEAPRDAGPSPSASGAPRKPVKKSATKPSSKPPRKPAVKKSATAAPEDEFWDQKPDCAHYEGTAVSKKKAAAALNAAAGRRYWPTSAPTLKLSADLVRAIAWQESGWQSNIVNCDGGFGLMQTMPGTVTFVNQRFEKDYDARDHRQNAVIGANYLAWLTRKFGDNYFDKKYDLSTRGCRKPTDMCLLNMVIAAYNAGDGTVEQGFDGGELPNPAYVDSVRSLMRTCYCDRF